MLIKNNARLSQYARYVDSFDNRILNKRVIFGVLYCWGSKEE